MMKKEVLAAACSIALLPPIWAVGAPYVGVTVGAVALICAALFAAGGGGAALGGRLSTGFLLGDVWAVLVLWLTAHLPLPADAALFVTLAVMGGLVVLLSALLPRWISCPAWLGGMAVGLTILAPLGSGNLGTLPIQIAAAMLVGVWYVGFVGDLFAAWLLRLGRRRER